jgi:hypothetical protein
MVSWRLTRLSRDLKRTRDLEREQGMRCPNEAYAAGDVYTR